MPRPSGAIKHCRMADGHDADMLLRETRYLQNLRHPRLVSYLGFCKHQRQVYLLMEFMAGGSLHALLFGSTSKRRRLAFATQTRMAHQVAEGLAYLHTLNVVHRDLKTHNIVLDSETTCKICDFGLTVTLEQSHLTVKALQGSPRYMAPEQFEITAHITEKVDIWQMGCVMLELYCKFVPFSGSSGVHQIATELLLKKRPPRCPTDADPRCRALVQACLRIQAKNRPAAATLEHALSVVHDTCTQADK